MRILVGSVTNKEPEVLQAHLESLQNQELPDNVKLTFLYIADPELSEESRKVLESFGVKVSEASPKPLDAEYEVSESTHHWNKPTFYWLGSQKQRILDAGKDFDAIFFVDTDLVLDSGTLKSLLDTKKDVVSGIFWTKWAPGMPALPQCWMENPYEMQGRGVEAHEHLANAASRQLWKVGGTGACLLIRKEVLAKVRYSPRVEGLPEDGMWQGEDRTFGIVAQRNHVDLWADGWPSIFHIYRPSDLQKVQDTARKISESRKRVPSTGDLVSLRLTPVEEGNLAGWSLSWRGVLGSNELLYSLDKHVRSLQVGEDVFAQVKFPVWWEVPEYRNTTKTIRVELLDCRENIPHPTRADDEDFGVYYES